MTDLTPCAHCGQLVEFTNAVNTDNGLEVWCDECVERDGFYCPRCGEYHEGEGEEVHVCNETATWCEHCADSHANVCDCCNDLVDAVFTNNIYVYGVGRQTICDRCIDDYYRCSVCGDCCREDDVMYCNGDYYCPSCAPARYVDSYHHTEATSFLRTSELDGGPYLGVELEMEFPTDSYRTDAAEYIRTSVRYGDFYECKEDSSLEDYGLECVTQPATLLYHVTGYDDLMLSAGTLFDAVSHDSGNCGLHVHIDRAFFNDTNIDRACYRAGYILDTLISNNEPYVLRFTRRTYSQLNRWAQTVVTCRDKERRTFVEKFGDYRAAKYTRYQAVNMDNDETIELRLFRGTLNRETYYATLEFAAALALIARALLPVPEFADTMSWQDVKTEVVSALGTLGLPCDEFIGYCDRRGL